jgi:hypothetical protein
MISKKLFQIAILCAVALVTGCDEWDDHNKLQQDELGRNLLQAINEEPSLTTFSGYLEATGYDKVLTTSKTFTVWAPSNEALAGLSPDIVNDTDKLTEFIGNHISYQQYFTATASGERVKMLNGKNVNWYGTALEDATVETSDQLARNGVFHVISSSVLPKQNTWELFESGDDGQKLLGYLQSLTYDLFVDSLATQIGIDPATGQPIYEPGTGYVTKNYFFDEVFDISNEDSLNTFIVLTDESFDAELAKLVPYFHTITVDQDSTDSLASWHMAKDLVIRGLVKPEDLPDTLISVDGVKVPVDQTAIVETHYTSNGIVYVMNKVDFRLQDKFPPIIIQGEKPDGFRTSSSTATHYRSRDWASGNFDLRIWDHNIAQYYVRYRVDALPSMTYKVYWRTVNDFVDTVANPTAFQEKLMASLASSVIVTGAPTPLKDFGYVKVNYIKANPELNAPKYLGDLAFANYDRLYLFVVANNSTTDALNPIEIDYIKLVPVFN